MSASAWATVASPNCRASHGRHPGPGLVTGPSEVGEHEGVDRSSRVDSERDVRLPGGAGRVIAVTRAGNAVEGDHVMVPELLDPGLVSAERLGAFPLVLVTAESEIRFLVTTSSVLVSAR